MALRQKNTKNFQVALRKRMAEQRAKLGFTRLEMSRRFEHYYAQANPNAALSDYPMLHPLHIYQLEKGMRSGCAVQLDTVIKLALVLKCSVDYLLGWTDDPTMTVSKKKLLQALTPVAGSEVQPIVQSLEPAVDT